MNTETKVLGTIGIVTIALVAAAIFFLNKPEKPVIVDSSKLVKEDSNILATGSGKLSIVEFGDYQCPACGLAHAPLKQAIESYPGQVQFVFRHYPLAQHQNAELAAKAAEAAKLQGKLNEMHDKLYETQLDWSEKGNALDIFKGYAGEFGLDVGKFETDLKSDPVIQKIRADMADGNSLGVNATPTIYFNASVYKKGLGVADFKSEIESYLNR